MFNFAHWIKIFRDFPYFNDTEAIIKKASYPNWRILGIHALAKDEFTGQRAIYFDAHNKQNNRDRGQNILWNYGSQPVRTLRVTKPSNEIADLPLTPGMNVSMWIPGSDRVDGLSYDYPYGLFVFFQEVEKEYPDDPGCGNGDDEVKPVDPPPDIVDPLPKPSLRVKAIKQTVTIIDLKIKKSLIDLFPVDEEGFINISSLEIVGSGS